MAQDVVAGGYDCIIFYRWFTPDGRNERGRVMARLIAEVLEAMDVRVWLDQHEMSKSLSREHVVAGIYKAFQRAHFVVILAAPGDWERFTNKDDIHRWEWELSLKSGKPIWVLQFENAQTLPCRPSELALCLASFDDTLARLVARENIQIRTISTDNMDVILNEVANSSSSSVPQCKRRRRQARL